MRAALGIAAAAIALLGATGAQADEASLDWSLGDRLQGPASIDPAGAARPLSLHVSLDGRCPAKPSFAVDHDEVTFIRRPGCSFNLPAIATGKHELTMDVGDEHREAEIDAADHLVASIGDSVASGEGNPDVSPADWLERRCHRSLRSGAALAARAVELGDRHSAITFVPLACSGATIDEGILHEYDGIQPSSRLGPLPPQIDQLLALERPVEALLISVGANDVNFGSFAQFCVFVRDCPNRRFDPAHPRREAPPGTPTAAEVERQALARLPAAYDELAARLDGHVEPARTIIVEYFDPLRDTAGDTCEAALPGLSLEESQWAESNLLAPLNAAVHAAAARHGWQVVGGVAEAFRHHGLCAGRASWITDPLSSGAIELSLVGTLHPNGDGHVATATLIAPILASTLGVTPGAEQIGQGRRGYVFWAWLIVAFVAGAGVLLLLMRVLRR